MINWKMMERENNKKESNKKEKWAKARKIGSMAALILAAAMLASACGTDLIPLPEDNGAKELENADEAFGNEQAEEMVGEAEETVGEAEEMGSEIEENGSKKEETGGEAEELSSEAEEKSSETEGIGSEAEEKSSETEEMVGEAEKMGGVAVESESGERNVGEEETGTPNGFQAGGHGPNGNGGRGGGFDKSSDTELQDMINDVAPKFTLFTYEDEKTGISLEYQLFVPEDYDETKTYPLVQFIPDSSVIGKSAATVLTQGWGGLIWASAKEQEKHPSFVLVPVFTETVVNDKFEHSEQIEASVRLLWSVAEKYSIDKNRIYATGQSMGGMTSFYLNVAYPDLFAASLFVGSQWDNSTLDVLEDKNFFYIVSAGDPRASEGQEGLIAVFEQDQAPYTHAEWSAQDGSDAQDAAVKAMLEEGNHANFVTFTEGSTLPEGTSANTMAGEHMTSFDYAYKIEAVRDWLFEQ